MATAPRTGNTAALVIRSILQREHSLSVFSREMPHALGAEVLEVDLDSGQLLLEAQYSGKNIEGYLVDGTIGFDIETLRSVEPGEPGEHEIFTIDRVATRIIKTDSNTYRLECQLPESMFERENRGTICIPLILGMQARVGLEVYRHELNLAGRLRNLSVGGCMVNIEIADSVALGVDQQLPGVTLEFPNGEHFHAEGRIQHMRPLGTQGHAAVDIEFIALTAQQSETLFQLVAEAEREAAYRSGINQKMTGHSPLFIPGAKEKTILQREEQERHKRARQSPMQRGVAEIANQIQVALMFMKSRGQFPEQILYDCTDTLLYLAGQDRKALLYALSSLRDEPDWVRHAVQVAGQLADMLFIRDPHSALVREAVVGALLHTMGKPLLISEQLPSLKAHMKPQQKAILEGHVSALREKLEALEWTPSPTCRDILENANERLDGSGYPEGKQGETLTELVRLVSVIKVINKLTHERNGVAPRAPLEAYRWVDGNSQAYDKTLLVEYIQQHGLYPIGCLAKFSGGFLAWIMEVDAKGMPSKVNVIKNLAFMHTNIDSILTRKDFMQIGKLEGVVNPADYEIRSIK